MIIRVFACLAFLLSLIVTTPLSVTAQNDDPNPRPWFKPFTPVRTFYVSPNGNGNGQSASKPMSLHKALSDAKPGDLYRLLAGTYKGDFSPSKPGTEARPIVFRAEQGKRVIIEGGFSLKPANIWVWGFEITDPHGVQKGAGVEMLAPGVRVINNVIHSQFGDVGIGAWQQGKDQVVYGNIIYQQIPDNNRPHNIYAQNDFDKWGYKYIANNIILDAAEVDGAGNTQNVQCYAEGGLITGFWFEKNIVKNGRFLIGGFNAPAEHEVVKDNYFYRSIVQFGYRRPTQVRFQNNYLARSPLTTEWVWGAGETQFRQTAPSVYTGNEIVNPPGPHIRFSTSAYLSSGRCEGCPRIRPNDVFDQNKYTAPFRATFFADSKNMGLIDLPTWRRVTAAAGKAFDVNSVQVPAPTGIKTVIIKNDYDPSRAHIAVYNWSEATRVTLDLSSFLSQGAEFVIYQPKGIFQSPVVAGIYTGPIQIPLDREFGVFVVIRR